MPQPLRPSRFRRVAKWVMLALCAVAAALWAVGAVAGDGDASSPANSPSRLQVGSYFVEMSNGMIAVGGGKPSPPRFVAPGVTVTMGPPTYSMPVALLVLLVSMPTVVLCVLDRRKD